MQPYCCPVCQGRGLKPHSFYSPPMPGISFGAITCDVACRSCSGTGIVWRGEDDAEGQPAVVQPGPYPPTISFGGGVITYGEGHSLTVGAGSFTTVQGFVPAERRESSVDPAFNRADYTLNAYGDGEKVTRLANGELLTDLNIDAYRRGEIQ